MDMRRLRSGELLAGAGAAGLAVALALDWFGGRSAWSTLPIGCLLLALTLALAVALVVLTLRAGAVATATSAATLTIGVGTLALVELLYRVGIDEPGGNALVGVDAGAYLGLASVVVVLAGAWRTLADERTGAAASLRQTERVLSVRGGPRAAPSPRERERAAGSRPDDGPQSPRGGAS